MLEKHHVKEYLRKLAVHKSVGPDGKSCLTKLITFYEEMTVLVDEGRAVVF